MNAPSNAASALAAELAPSDETLAQTVAAVGARLDRFAADGAHAQATIEKLDAALVSLQGGPGAGGQPWDLGALGLPVQGAWKAMTAMVSKVMTESTGTPFESWVAVMDGGTATFDDYLATLRAVTGLGDLADADLALLDEARIATVTWRAAMGPVAEFARLLDSMLAEMARRVNASAELAVAKPAQAGWMNQVQRAQQRIGEAVDVAAEKLHLTRADMVQLVLGPLQSVKDRAAGLPGELDALHREVTLLEDLLQLLQAQVRSARGELSQGEAEVAAITFAAVVRVPRLSADLSDTRAELGAVDSYLLGLGRLRHEQAVSEPTALILETEYLARGNAAYASLRQLEQRAGTWRAHGPALLEDGLAWVTREAELADARLAVGQWTPAEADLRRQYLQRERTSMEQAVVAIEGLQSSPVALSGA